MNSKPTAVNKTLAELLAKAFDYPSALKRINRTEDEIDQLRKLVLNEESIPNCVTNQHVSALQVSRMSFLSLEEN